DLSSTIHGSHLAAVIRHENGEAGRSGRRTTRSGDDARDPGARLRDRGRGVDDIRTSPDSRGAGPALLHEQRLLRLPHRWKDGDADRARSLEGRVQVLARISGALAPRSVRPAPERAHADPRAEPAAGDGPGRVPVLASLRRWRL